MHLRKLFFLSPSHQKANEIYGNSSAMMGGGEKTMRCSCGIFGKVLVKSIGFTPKNLNCFLLKTCFYR
jgi:hypothetical protein